MHPGAMEFIEHIGAALLVAAVAAAFLLMVWANGHQS